MVFLILAGIGDEAITHPQLKKKILSELHLNPKNG